MIFSKSIIIAINIINLFRICQIYLTIMKKPELIGRIYKKNYINLLFAERMGTNSNNIEVK